MKYLIALVLLSLIPSSAFSAKGMVLVLEAPIFIEKSLEAKVVQWVRKGDIIYIHDKHMIDSPLETDYTKINNIYEEDIDVISVMEKGLDPKLDYDEDDFISDEELLETGSDPDGNFKEFFENSEKDFKFDKEDKQKFNLNDEDWVDLETNKFELETFKEEGLRDKKKVQDYETRIKELEELLKDDIKELMDEVSKKDSASILVDRSDFYTTVDRNGRTAYIPKEYVKLIYKDEREFSQSVNPFTYDPTDYRLSEPLNPYHPFHYEDSMRGYLTYGTGTDPRTSYNYPREVISQEYGYKSIFSLRLLRQVNVDREQRLFFGGSIKFSLVNNLFLMEGTSVRSREKKVKWGFGPWFLYDTLVYKNMIFSLIGGIHAYYNQYGVEQYTETRGTDYRIYKGFSFGPTIGLAGIYKNIWKRYDLISELIIDTEFPHELTTSDSEDFSFPNYWQEDSIDSYSNNFQATFSFNIGLHYNF